MLLANFNRKEHLRHRAVSLRQHGFLVINVIVFSLYDIHFTANKMLNNYRRRRRVLEPWNS